MTDEDRGREILDHEAAERYKLDGWNGVYLVNSWQCEIIGRLARERDEALEKIKALQQEHDEESV